MPGEWRDGIEAASGVTVIHAGCMDGDAFESKLAVSLANLIQLWRIVMGLITVRSEASCLQSA